MQRFHILTLRAETPATLAGKLKEFNSDQRLASGGSTEGGWRLAIHARDGNELQQLRQLAGDTLEREGRIEHPQIFYGNATPVKTAWLFPGQGSQRLGMLLPLLDLWPEFAARFDALDRQWSPILGGSVRQWIAAPNTTANAAYLQDTRQAQPALGLIETALAFSWQKIGFKADFLAGHSYGELPALTAAGALDNIALAGISRQRGQLLGEAGDLAPGGMLAARSDAQTLVPLLAPLADRVFLANDNAPQQVVLAGTREALAEAAALLQAAGISSIPLKTACAFHSPLMAPIAERWREFLAGRVFKSFAAGRIYANTTAEPYDGSPEGVRDLLARQITAPVRWREEIEALYAAGCRLFVEIGPGHVLTDLTGKILGDRPHVRLASDPEQQPAEVFFPALLARLYSLGCDLDLSSFQPGPTDIPAQAIMTTTTLQALPMAPEAGFFEANQQAVSAFFEQQRQIVAALDGRADAPLFNEIVRANQTVMQEFMATQQAALGLAPGAAAMPIAMPAPGKDLVTPAMAAIAAAPTSAAPSGTTPDSDDVERWIVAQIAEMTGLPAQRIGRRTLFESELGIDSITLVELWIQLVERFPALGQSSGQVNSITCIDDILARLAQVAPAAPAPAAAAGTAAEIAPATPRTEAPAGSIEAWLLNELSMLTGLPVNRLNRDTRFEADLGIDSITMVELWIKLVEQFPQFGKYTDGASRVQSVAEALRLVGGDAPTESRPSAEVIEHPASNWLAQLRNDLIA
ncbi:MAG: acyltransferase domain-containing protein, partial [Betaproteobacteria bacterium]